MLENVEVTGSVDIEPSRLTGDLDVRSLTATGSVNISRADAGYFAAKITALEELNFSRCQFTNGGVITCRTRHLSFVECDARQPLTVASLVRDEPAKLISFPSTNLENFVLADIDMTSTMFTSAVGLDRLTVEGEPRFLRSPVMLGASRQVVQDEVVVRSQRKLRLFGKWRAGRWGKLVADTPAVPTDMHKVAAIYRSLRKSREDSKDEPGGADFYYGEMEMRRIAASPISAERWLLTSYWLFAGYALRAWRAFLGLSLTLAVGSLLLYQFGYIKHHAMNIITSGSLLLEIVIGIAKSPSGLTQPGVLVLTVARFLMAAFLAMALVALRSRVKR